MRKTAHIMGMPISLDIPDCFDGQVFKKAFSELHRIDLQFSPYKPDSELSRFRRGELNHEHLSIGMQNVMKACLEAEVETDGYFSSRFDGSFEPSGYVKGWAISEVGKQLLKDGFETFCLSAGGDILANSAGSKEWSIGLQDPEHRSQIVGTVKFKSMAVATSGTYERGLHIFNPKTGKPADFFVSVTIVGPDIITADIYATAAFAMGKPGLEFIDAKPGYEIMAIDTRGTIYVSTGMKALLEA